MSDDPHWKIKMEHLVVGLVFMRLSASLEARVAKVEVEAYSALVASPNNGLIASIAVGGMDGQGRGCRDRGHRGLGFLGVWRESNGMIPTLFHMECRMFDRSALHIASQTLDASIDCAATVALVSGTFVDAADTQRRHRPVADGRRSDNADRVFDVHEPMHRRVLGNREPNGVALVAEVKVGASHALVPRATDLGLARVTPVRQRTSWALVPGIARFANVASEGARKN
jgi:hypothetical protein